MVCLACVFSIGRRREWGSEFVTVVGCLLVGGAHTIAYTSSY